MLYKLGFNSWSSEEISAIKKVYQSGNYTMGKYVEAFEKKFAYRMGSKYAIM